MSVATINVVWFKRDLRLRDHAPLYAAIESGRPTVLLYVFENALIADPHYSLRHWRVVWQSLQDLNQSLAPHGATMQVVVGCALEALEAIRANYVIHSLYSHEEIGLDVTFARDSAAKAYCQKHHIQWNEYASGAVQRGLADRTGWDAAWKRVMRGP